MNVDRSIALALMLVCCSITASAQGGAGAKSIQDGESILYPDVTRKARLLTKPQPGHTEEAKKLDVDGPVLLRMVLSSSGEVTNISVVEGLPYGLTEKAIEAAKKIKFEPALKDGRPVSQWVTVQYNFNIYSEDEVAKKAVIISKPEPEYTDEARREKYSGVVVIEAILMRNGEIKRIVFPGGVPPHGLRDKVVEAALRIKFTPAEQNGRPVSQHITIEYKLSPKE